MTERIKKDRALSIYAYGNTFDESTTYATEENYINAAIGETAIATVDLKGTSHALTSEQDAITDESYTKVDAWTNNIDITKYVSGLESGKFSILLKKDAEETDATKIFTKDATDETVTNTSVTAGSFTAANIVPQLSVTYTRNSYDLEVTDAGAATLVLPYDATIPDGVKAYTLTYTSGSSATATEVTGTIPANTPVLINATAGTYTFNATATVTSKEATPAEGSLTGVWEETSVPANAYVLQNKNGTIGFYKVQDDGSVKVGANRAYLTASASAAKVISINFGGVTGITSAQVDATADDAVYTLQGTRVDGGNLTNGLYIKGGKKIIIK